MGRRAGKRPPISVPGRSSAVARDPDPARRFWPAVFFASDLLIMNLALYAAIHLRLTFPIEEWARPDYSLLWITSMIVFSASWFAYGLYRSPEKAPPSHAVFSALKAGLAAGLFLMAFVFIARAHNISRLVVLTFLAATILGTVWLRLALYRLRLALLRRGVERIPVAILELESGGAGRIRRIVRKWPQLGYAIEGRRYIIKHASLTEMRRRLDSLAGSEPRPGIVFVGGLPFDENGVIGMLEDYARSTGIRVVMVPAESETLMKRTCLHDIPGVPIHRMETSRTSVEATIKTLMDRLVSTAAVVLTAPFLLLFALLVRLETGGSALFRQTRVGKGGGRFTLYKFRTMVEGAEEMLEKIQHLNEAGGPIFKMKNDPRVTRIGRFLRKFSLDELPQILNVILGHISIVGPRPPLPEEVDGYNWWHEKRLEVRQGITGLWQVSGRSDLSFDEMVLLDIYYSENWSPALDIEILLRTVPAVLFGRGAY